MHAVLINQFYPPAVAPTGRLLRDLARALAGRGHRVTVLTSAALYGGVGGAAPQEDQGVNVIRIGPRARHRHGMLAKLQDYRAFFRQADRTLAQLQPRPDAVVCMTTPPFCGLIGERMRRRHGTAFVLWCMDLYPEALVAHGLVGRRNPAYRLLQGFARRERRGANAVVTLGPDMSARVHRDDPVQVTEIPVWSELTASPDVERTARELRAERGWRDDEVVLLYSGNMGRAHRAEEFAELAHRLRARGVRSRIVMSGEGPMKAEWMRRWGDRFEFMPPAPGPLTAAHLLSADAHLISQQEAWTGVVVPSKFQAACALGRPVIFAGPEQSSVGTWIAESGAGWVVSAGKPDALETVVRDLAGSDWRKRGLQARELYVARFDPVILVGRLCGLIESLPA